MNREYLETLSFKELKEMGKEYNVTSNSSEGLITKILEITEMEIIHEEEELNTQLGDEEFDEFERNQDGEIIMMEDTEHIETVTDITEHIKTIELYQNEHRWIKLRYNMIKKLSGDTYINNIIELSDHIFGMVNSGVINKIFEGDLY